MERGLLPRVSNRRRRTPFADVSWRPLLPVLAGCSGFFWLAMSILWLLIRRAAGGMQSPLSGPALLVTSIGTGMTTLAIAELLRPPAGRSGWAQPVWLSVGFVPLLVVLAAVLTLPGTSTAGLAVLWCVTGCAIAGVVLRARTIGPVRTGLVASRHDSLRGSPPSHPDRRPAAADREPLLGEGQDGGLPEGVDQQLTRGCDESGRCYLHGTLRVELPARHRLVHVHIAICPPWAHPPNVQVEQIAGPAVTLNVGMSLPQGIRFDVKRQGADAAHERVVLEFYGQ